RAVRLDVAAEFVAAKKCVACEKRVAFAFEIQSVRQPKNFITVLFHPTREIRGFTRPFLMAEITRDKSLADGEPGVGSEYHVGQFRLWRHQLDLRLEGGERFVQPLPLRFRQLGFGATPAGLISTARVFTLPGSRFATAIEWNIVPINKASLTSSIFSRIRRCASIESVTTSGNGPSSRIDPVRRRSTFCFTQACMMPR